jgi:uncharacterized membrane protein YccF (DUF307 family)
MKLTPDSSEHSDRLVIYPSRLKTLLVLLGSIAFVVIGIWIATPEVARGVATWKVVISSYVGVPFFAACGLSTRPTGWRAIDRRLRSIRRACPAGPRHLPEPSARRAEISN